MIFYTKHLGIYYKISLRLRRRSLRRRSIGFKQDVYSYALTASSNYDKTY